MWLAWQVLSIASTLLRQLHPLRTPAIRARPALGLAVVVSLLGVTANRALVLPPPPGAGGAAPTKPVHASLCTLGSTCHWLRFVSRHPPFWEAFCRGAFRVERGFLDNDRMLRSYSWSWRSMFMRRKRLRYDGVYYLATKRLLHGLNEGRGMKEADKDFYNPAGNWVTQYRLLRFFPCGAMFSYLCASAAPWN